MVLKIRQSKKLVKRCKKENCIYLYDPPPPILIKRWTKGLFIYDVSISVFLKMLFIEFAQSCINILERLILSFRFLSQKLTECPIMLPISLTFFQSEPNFGFCWFIYRPLILILRTKFINICKCLIFGPQFKVSKNCY